MTRIVGVCGSRWVLVTALAAVGCGGSAPSPAPEPEVVAQVASAAEAGVQPESGSGIPADASPTDAAPCVHPKDSPFVDAGGGCLVGGTLPIGSPCTSDTQCEPSSYVGPLLLSWGCYPMPGGSGSVCSFRCDDVSGVPLVPNPAPPNPLLPTCAGYYGDGGSCNEPLVPADAQVSPDQPANIPPVCQQLGGHCVADPSLPATNGVSGAIFYGTRSLCATP